MSREKLFVLYRYEDGFGSADVYCSVSVSSFEVIEAIQTKLQDEFGYSKVIVLNWRRYEDPE